MSFDATKSVTYPIVSFKDQKFQTRVQKYTLIAHAYLYAGLSFILGPLSRILPRIVFHSGNPVHSSQLNIPSDESQINLVRPLYARIASQIHIYLMMAVNVVTFPFRWLYDLAIHTDQFEARFKTPEHSAK